VTVRRIAYQGEPGANSHIVCQQHHPDAEAVACASFEDVFAAVTGGDADLAMIPIDNSIAGRVADIHHFLPTSGLHIVGEHFLRIQFMVMGVPGTTLETVRTVHSHVHALGQCRKIIGQHGWTPIVSGDTAGAAREIAEAADVTSAAIARPRSTASTSSPQTSRTRTTTPRASWSCPASRCAHPRGRAPSSPPSSSTSATSPPPSTRHSAGSPRTAST
jgi:prephenate dehydratase